MEFLFISNLCHLADGKVFEGQCHRCIQTLLHICSKLRPCIPCSLEALFIFLIKPWTVRTEPKNKYMGGNVPKYSFLLYSRTVVHLFFKVEGVTITIITIVIIYFRVRRHETGCSFWVHPSLHKVTLPI